MLTVQFVLLQVTETFFVASERGVNIFFYLNDEYMGVRLDGMMTIRRQAIIKILMAIC